MIRSSLLLAVALAAFAAPATAQVDATFAEGVDLLSRGQNEEALKAFQKVLAMDPSNEDAYELWKTTDHQVWMSMLTLEGEYELVAKRLMDLASMGRTERRNDPDAVRALLADVGNEDVATRTRAVRTLAAEHGEYAVPFLLFALADQDKDDRRVLTMQALTNMGTDVVLPLVEALHSPDPYLRRNVALTLGYIGDSRANAALAHIAAADSDTGARSAAEQALERIGGERNAAEAFLALADAYYGESDTVLMPHQYSNVVWNWEGEGLVATEVPRFLYPLELAKKGYYRALESMPSSTPALAGIGRVAAAEETRLAEWAAVGQDVEVWQGLVAGDMLALQLVGAPALDVALGWSLDHGDQAAAAGICRALGGAAATPTPNLGNALRANTSAAVRGEAAVALGRIAYVSRTAASDTVVQALAEAASREVVRIAAVIDGDEIRRVSFADALAGEGFFVNSWGGGAIGLSSLRSIPGVDLLLVADTLPDLTTDQVIDEIRRDPRTAETPIVVISSATDAADLFGDKITGTVAAVAEMEGVEGVLEAGLNRDRELANDLASRAARTLWMLAAGPTDVSTAAEALASTLEKRPDSVVVPALGALAVAGNSAQARDVVAVLADAERSEEARIAAARALSGIFGRSPVADAGTLEDLRGVAAGDGSFEVRAAAASALGRLDLSDGVRAELLRNVRG